MRQQHRAGEKLFVDWAISCSVNSPCSRNRLNRLFG